MVAGDNDDFPAGEMGIIDIDGGLTEDGRVKSWVPSLDTITDSGTYIKKYHRGRAFIFHSKDRFLIGGKTVNSRIRITKASNV